MSDELVVSVTLFLSMDYLRGEYARAISPDGGYEGPFEEWVAGYAAGMVYDMEGASVSARAESKWEVRGRVG